MIKVIEKLVTKFLSANNILILFRYGNSIGDQLLMTGVANLIKKKYKYKIIILTKFPELFSYNPNIYKVYKINTSNLISRIVIKIIKKINSPLIKEFLYKQDNGRIFNLSNFKNQHIAEYNSLNLNLNLNFNNFRNQIFFSDDEIKKFENNLKLPEKFALIMSEGKISFTPNREWGIRNFQHIVNATQKIKWIQIGKDTDYKIKNTFYLYTKSNLRELAYIIYRSKLLVCLEGFYYHLANSFNMKKILIMSGFMSKQNIYYKNNNNIIINKIKHLKCYPCYKLYNCDIPKKPCTNLITPSEVVKEIIKNY
jgi:ADP-heptose:LPS heptosyltransferase